MPSARFVCLKMPKVTLKFVHLKYSESNNKWNFLWPPLLKTVPLWVSEKKWIFSMTTQNFSYKECSFRETRVKGFRIGRLIDNHVLLAFFPDGEQSFYIPVVEFSKIVVQNDPFFQITMKLSFLIGFSSFWPCWNSNFWLIFCFHYNIVAYFHQMTLQNVKKNSILKK